MNKKFNWKEFGIYCAVGAGIGFITSLIEVIVKTIRRKRAIKQAEAEERAEAIKKNNERIREQEEEFEAIKAKIDADRARMKERAMERRAITDSLTEINAKLDQETDPEKIAELQEEQRKLLASLTSRIIREV